MNKACHTSLVLLAAASFGCNSDKISRLEKQNQELLAQLKQQQTAANLDLQAKCAKQAREMFREDGWDKEQSTGYVNHYNVKVNMCFIQVTSMKSQAKPYVPTVYKSVADAFEGKTYAEYFWANSEGKEYWEVAPNICKVTSLSGEETFCRSADEFDSLVKQFME